MTEPNVQVAVKPKDFKSYKAFTILNKDFGDSLVQVDIPNYLNSLVVIVEPIVFED